MNLQSFPSKVAAFWTWLPCKRVVFIVLFLFFVKEFYPFSHFPMYSGLAEDVDLFYVRASADERPIPVLAAYNIRTSRIKKMFGTELSEITARRGERRHRANDAERKEAGERVLRELVRQMSPAQREIYPFEGIELMQVTVELKNSKFERGEAKIAELPAEVSTAPEGNSAPKGPLEGQP